MADLTITDECVGCETCVELCPAVFVMDDAGEKALVKNPSAEDDCVEEAMESCPVQAIVRE